MGIDMYLEESHTQSTSVAAMCQSHLESYQELQRAIENFANDTISLQGQAYDSARSFFSSVLVPLSLGGQLYAEGLSQAIAKLPADYEAMVDSRSWREDELLDNIQYEEMVIANLDASNQSLMTLKIPSSLKSQLRRHYANLIRSHHANKHTYQTILEDLRAYHTYSNGLFDDLADIQAWLATGLSQVDGAWDSATGKFTLPKDLRWASCITAYNATKDLAYTAEEKEFITNVMVEYGFDVATAEQILKVSHGLDDKFPDLPQKERDYLLMRIIGSVSYGGDSLVNGNLWAVTAGPLLYYFPDEEIVGDTQFYVEMSFDEIMAELGLTEAESKNLYKNLTLQHGLSGEVENLNTHNEDDLMRYARRVVSDYKNNKGIDITIDEVMYGIKNMYRKADFTHQSITMATHLRPNIAYGPVNGHVEDLSGWEGDTTKNANDMDPSIGIDDYLADLDAVNITSRMASGQTYLETVNAYHADLNNGKISREVEFKQNIDIEEVKETIISSLVPKEIGEVIAIEPSTGVIYTPLIESEQRAYLKKYYNGSYKFIKSLEEEKNMFDEEE